jgi:selenide,water dikinase
VLEHFDRTSVIVKHLVLIGGGHSHAIVLKMFGIQPLPSVRLTLISDVLHAPYSGMLPGHVAGFYGYDECHIDLRSLAEFAGCQILIDRAIAIDINKNLVICQTRPPVNFDLLSVDIGSTPATLSVPGAAEYAIAAKPVPEFLASWNQLISQRLNHPQKPLRIAIVGGGAGGVELALNMQSRLGKEEGFGNGLCNGFNGWILRYSERLKREKGRGKKEEELEIHLFHSGAELMQGHNQRVRRRIQEILISRGIQLHLKEKVCAVKKIERETTLQFPSDYQLSCESGLELECDRIFWVTQASAANWIRESGLAADSNGFMQVNNCLQSVSHPNVFGAGDIAAMVNYPRPKAGVFAVRQGKPLFENLQQFLVEKPLKPFAPQEQYLGLIGTGNKRAIASRGSFMWESALLWYWKDWIDRQFMQKFSNLPKTRNTK